MQIQIPTETLLASHVEAPVCQMHSMKTFLSQLQIFLNASARVMNLLRLTFSALCLLLVSMATSRAQSNCQISQMEIPVRIIDSRPIATLILNGVEVQFLVDSGAFYSFLSASTAARLNLPLRNLPKGMTLSGYTGRIEAMRTTVEKVKLRNAEISGVEFIVGGNELNAGIMGVLGRNILSIADTEYDLAHGAVRLTFPKGDCEKANLAYWAGNAPIIAAPLDRAENKADTEIRVGVRVNGTWTLGLLDTGAPQTALTLSTAYRSGIEKRDLTPYGQVGGFGEGHVDSWTGPVATFEMGGEKVTKTQMRIDDNDRAGHGILIGLDYFLSHRIYVSRLQGKFYATWNGGPVFALGRPEMGNVDARDAALPQEVANDDADALARRGLAAIAMGNYQLALRDLNRACELAPGVADYFFSRARLHLEMEKPDLALADFDRSLQLDPSSTEVRIRRAQLRASRNDKTGALADLVQLDAALTQSSNLRADMASLYVRLEQTPEALRQFDLWINSHKQDTRLASVLNSRCWLRATRNIDLQLALRDCKESVEIDDSSYASRDSLGWTYLRLGDAAKAKVAFDGAIKVKVRPFSLYGRGLALARLNDLVNSQLDFAAARKLNPKIDEELRNEGFEFAVQ